MSKKYLIVIGGLLAALLVVGVVGATSAFAQGPDGEGRGPGKGRGLSDAGLEAAAGVLGMSVDELSSALEDGQRLPELAEAAGVDIEDLHTALQAVHETEMRERIAQAVADGDMTQAQADWMLQGIDNGYMLGKGGPGGFGRGNGGSRGGGHGFGPGNGTGDCPMGQPLVQNIQ
jgi:hypothetical protein